MIQIRLLSGIWEAGDPPLFDLPARLMTSILRHDDLGFAVINNAGNGGQVSVEGPDNVTPGHSSVMDRHIYYLGTQ